MAMTKKKAFWFLVICAVLWSTGGFLIKSVDMPPFAITGGRSMFAALFLILVRGKPRFSRRPVFIGASLAYAATMTCFVFATRLTTAADAIMLQYTAPVWVLLLSYFLLKERVTKLDVLVTFLILAGLVVFFLDSLGKAEPMSTAPLGNALGLLSGVFVSFQAVLIRRTSDEGLSTESVIVAGNLICFFASLPLLLRSTFTLENVMWLAIAGFFQLGLAYVFYTAVLPYVTALELILVPVIEPILNPIFVFFLNGEKPALTTVIAGIFILTLVTVWCVYRAKEQGVPLNVTAEASAQEEV